MRGAAALNVVIDNLSEIETVYSEGAAARVLHEVWRSLDSSFWESVPEAWGVALYPLAGSISPSVWDELERSIDECASRPINAGTAQVVARLSCTANPAEERPDMSGSFNAVAYWTDMQAAVSAYDAMASNRVLFAEQSVAGIGTDAVELYRECLVRLTDGFGQLLRPCDFIPMLEQLGLTRAFDKRVVQYTLAELRRRPGDVLGCNISAQSVVKDFWWTSILAELALDRQLAERLIIEITETAEVPDLRKAVDFVAALRATGARVALDDFGIRVSSIALAQQGTVDIVKIDGFYLQLSRTDNGRVLGHLTALARDLADEVVVEGVESDTDLQLVTAAGARWAQGLHIAPPRHNRGDGHADIGGASIQ